MMLHRRSRNGKITREEGVALVRRYDHEFPQKYFREFLEYIGISEARFCELIDSGTLAPPVASGPLVSGSLDMQCGWRIVNE